MAQPLHIMMNLLHAQATLTGTGYYARYLAEALLRLPGAPRITGVASPLNRAAFRIDGAPNYRLLRWGRPWQSTGARRIEEWLFLNSLIRQVRPDVFFGPSNFLPLRRTCPMVVTIHDMTFFEHPQLLPPVRRWYWHRWTHRTIKVADAILTVSHAAKKDIVHYGDVDPERITVVPNGTASRFFIGEDVRGRTRRRRELIQRFPQLPARYVLFLGTLTPHKNVPRLVEAVAQARDLGARDMELVLAGKRGTGFEKIESAIADNGLGGAVHELGYVDDKWLPALYENARVHVLPSFTEGFGLPITEAMACGTPVVTSNRGAMQEVAGEAALLINPLDAGDMAAALHRLWSDEGLHGEMRRRGLARAREFTWDAAARRTYEVLERVARTVR